MNNAPYDKQGEHLTDLFIVGLGGAGVNTLQSLLESDALTDYVLSKENKIACIALDTAQKDLTNLYSAYHKALVKMEGKGLADSLWLKTVTLQIDKQGTLADFLEKYDLRLMRDGIEVNNYKPWIQESTPIPDIVNGISKMRAIGKATYCFNYYCRPDINRTLLEFKDRIGASKTSAIILVIFAIGSGTGSGILLDFAKDLRKGLSASASIIGVGILPSAYESLPERSYAAYYSLLESELILNKTLNKELVKEYGESYRNPFSSFLFLDLDSACGSAANLPNAKKELGKALAEVISIFENCDMPYMLSKIGMDNNLEGSRWVNCLGHLRIKYPVNEYVSYLQNCISLTDQLGYLLNIKEETFGKINGIIKRRFAELVEFFKAQPALYKGAEEGVDSSVESMINRDGKLNLELAEQLSAIKALALYSDEKYSKILQAIEFQTDARSEAVVKDHLEKFKDIIENPSKLNAYCMDSSTFGLTDEHYIEREIDRCTSLAVPQREQLKAYVNLAGLIKIASETVLNCLKTKKLANELLIRFSQSQFEQRQRIISMRETELKPLFQIVDSMLKKPEAEVDTCNECLPGVNVLETLLQRRFIDAKKNSEITEAKIGPKKAQIDAFKKEMDAIRLDIRGRRRVLQDSISLTEKEIETISKVFENQLTLREQLRRELDDISYLHSVIDPSMTYRKKLDFFINSERSTRCQLNDLATPSGFDERIIELTEAEQINILSKIIGGDDRLLDHWDELKNALDWDHFQDKIREQLRSFGKSSCSVFTSKYSSNFFLAIVSTPVNLWIDELKSTLLNSIEVHADNDSKSDMQLKFIPQVEPWTITVTIILTNASIDVIRRFFTMKNEAETLRERDRVMYRSFLLEQGVNMVEAEIDRLRNRAKLEKYMK